MSETNELTSQYSAQVAGDLERNLKEQERLSGEIEAPEAQLASLWHDHTVLVNIQQALGIPAPVAVPAAESVASVPAARKKASGAAKQPAAGRKRTGKKAAKAPAASSASPMLVDLVREHLAGQSEPRSAAEITSALSLVADGRGDGRQTALGDQVTGGVEVQPVDAVGQCKGAALAQGMADGGPGQGYPQVTRVVGPSGPGPVSSRVSMSKAMTLRREYAMTRRGPAEGRAVVGTASARR
jgi:hypothetical protein